MELKQLEAFVSVASLRSFRAAATRLHITQPAVSSRITALESELGTSLFDRSGNRVRITGKGFELLRYAENALDVAKQMIGAARGPNAVQATARIGATGSMVHSWAPKFIEALRIEYPRLDVELHVDTSPRVRALLLDGEIDLALIMGRVDARGIQNLPLAKYKVQWVVSPRLNLPPDPVPLELIASHPIMTYSRDSATHLAIQQIFQARGLWPVRIGGSNSTEAILRIAESGFAIGVVVADSMQESSKRGQLRVLKLASRLPEFEYMACYRFDASGTIGKAAAELAQKICLQHGATSSRRRGRRAQ
jgi:DNA-binding transcriptional LysR family regulator